jgi:hypothetical protein
MPLLWSILNLIEESTFRAFSLGGTSVVYSKGTCAVSRL